MFIANDLQFCTMLHFGQGTSARRSECCCVVVELPLDGHHDALGNGGNDTRSQALWSRVSPLAIDLTDSRGVAEDQHARLTTEDDTGTETVTTFWGEEEEKKRRIDYLNRLDFIQF